MKTKIIRYLRSMSLVVLTLLLVGINRATSGSMPAPAAEPNQFCLTLIEGGTHHLGDTPVPGWEVPNPEGPLWSKSFNSPIFDQAVIRFETYEANDVTVRVNGEVMLHIVGEPPTWRFHALLVDQDMLVRDGNLIRIEANGPTGDKDDFMFRNVGLVTCYATIEFNPHHLGNTYSEHWLIPSPESTSMTITFPLSESIPGTSLLALDVFDNTEPAQIKVNGTAVGGVQNGVPETWKTSSVVVDGTLLDPLSNTITITPGSVGGSSDPWDDLTFKNVRLYYETRATRAVYMPQIR